MAQPQDRMWIDARHQRLQTGRREEVSYIIPYINMAAVWELIYSNLATLVWEIQKPVEGQDLIKVIYDPDRITPSYIDYLLQQKGIEFRRLHN